MSITWTYGEHLTCGTLSDWATGDELICITLPGATYPTEAMCRVTSLVHRWRPGMFTLTMGLGEVTSELILRDIVGRMYRPSGDGPTPPPDEAPPYTIPGPCIVGSHRCIGQHLYQCKPVPTTDPAVYADSVWVLEQANSPICYWEIP